MLFFDIATTLIFVQLPHSNIELDGKNEMREGKWGSEARGSEIVKVLFLRIHEEVPKSDIVFFDIFLSLNDEIFSLILVKNRLLW